MKVSIIIPTCDREELLQRALNSLSEQDFDDFEVIIIDDFSISKVDKDSFENFKFPIKIMRNKTREYGAVSRNIGIENSKGEYICFLDDDDEYLPRKLSVLSQYLDENPRVDCVFGNTKRTEGKTKKVKNWMLNNEGQVTSFLAIPCMHTNSTLIRRNVLSFILFNEALGKYQDTQFHADLISKCNVYHLDIDVCRWYVTHALPQITDMGSTNNIKRTLDNVHILTEYLLSNGCLSITNKLITKLNYYRVSLKFIKAPQKISNVGFLEHYIYSFLFKLVYMVK